MSLAKKAQFNWEDEGDLPTGAEEPVMLADDNNCGEEILSIDEDYGFELNEASDKEEDKEEEPEVDLEGEGDAAIIIDEIGDDEEPMVYKFDLSFIPGSELTEEEDEISIDEPEDEVSVEEKDMWDWKSGGLGSFVPWLHSMLNNVPSHSGYDTAGVERASSYLDAINKAISQAVRTDLRGELDLSAVNDARNACLTGKDRLDARLEQLNKYLGKSKKQASEIDGQIVKEAQKITGVGHVIITVPLLISRIARVCINGMVSAGHDIEDIFDKQASKYNLDVREQAELMQLLEDMGYPIRRDRGFLRDEEIDRTKSDNFDWAANYPA